MGLNGLMKENEMKGNKATLTTCVRVRRDGIDRVNYGLTSPLLTSVKRSHDMHVAVVEIGQRPEMGQEKFFYELEVALDGVDTEYVYLASDNCEVSERFFGFSVQTLEETGAGAILSGVRRLNEFGALKGEFFTAACHDVRDRSSGNGCFDGDSFLHSETACIDVSAALGAFFWRRTELMGLAESMRGTTTVDELITRLNEWYVSEIKTRHVVASLRVDVHQGLATSHERRFRTAVNLAQRGQGRGVEQLIALRREHLHDARVAKSLAFYFLELGMPTAALAMCRGGFARVAPDPALCEQVERTWSNHQPTFDEVAPLIGSVPGHLYGGQEKYLYDKVASLPAGARVLEIGSNYGRSTVAMAFACVGTDKSITCIDTFVGMSNGGTKERGCSFRDIWDVNVGQFGLRPLLTPLEGCSQEVLRTLSLDEPFDFVFIDASHHFDHVLEDFGLVYPLVKNGGWISFHDVTPSWPGPWRVWRETARYLLSEHEYCASIACGRMQEGVSYVVNPESSEFSYSLEWTDFVTEKSPQVGRLLDYYRKALLSGDWERAKRCEASFIKIGHSLRDDLREMLKLEAGEDGVLNYWLAVLEQEEGRVEAALQRLVIAQATGPDVLHKCIERFKQELALRAPVVQNEDCFAAG